ncbi:MAG: hypothetical protein JST46_01245 [Bacteroidetes bacterium]|nr:hypothetical protein [Bacteroidota bacterium]
MPPASKTSRIARRILIGFFSAIILFFAILWAVLQFRKDLILREFVAFVNEKQSGHMEMGKMDLSLLAHFPQTSIVVSDVRYSEPAPSSGEEPLLFTAGELFATIDIWQLIYHSELVLSSAGITDAHLKLARDSSGSWNVQRALKPKDQGQDKGMALNLSAIYLKNVAVEVANSQVKEPAKATINNMKAAIEDNADSLTAHVQMALTLNSLNIGTASISDWGAIEAEIVLNYNKQSRQISLSKGSIGYKALQLSCAGTYGLEAEKPLDVKFQVVSSDFALLSELIRQDVVQMNPDLLKGGHTYFNGRIFGNLEDGMPQMEFKAGAKQITIQLPDQLGSFSNVGFELTFHSGTADDFSDGDLRVEQISGKLPGGSMAGYFRLKNLKDPLVDCNIYATANLKSYDKVFRFRTLRDLEGQVSFSLKLKNFQAERSKRKGIPAAQLDLKFTDVGLTSLRSGQRLSNVSGTLSAAEDNLELDLTHFQYDSTLLAASGKVTNPFHVLLKYDTSVTAELHFRSERFLTKHIIMDSSRTANVMDVARDLRLDLIARTNVKSIWQHTVPDFDFDITHFSARMDRLADIRELNARGKWYSKGLDRVLQIEGLHASFQQGLIDLQGSMTRRPNRQLEIDANVSIKQLPWNHLDDLIASINHTHQPSAKMLTPAEMNLITANLDLSAVLNPRPFSIGQLQLAKSNVLLEFSQGLSINAEKLDLDVSELAFKRMNSSSAVTGIQSLRGSLFINSLTLPGFGKASLSLKADAVNNEQLAGTTLEIHELSLRLPDGGLSVEGNLQMPSLNEMIMSTNTEMNRLSLSQLVHLVNVIQLRKPEEGSPALPRILDVKAELNTSWLLKPFQIRSLEVTNGAVDIALTDSLICRTSAVTASVTDMTFHQPGDSTFSMVTGLNGFVDIPSFQMGRRNAAKLRVEANGRGSQFDINILSNLLGGQNHGQLSLDFSGKPYSFRLQYADGQISSSSLAELFIKQKTFVGPARFRMDVQASGTKQSELFRTMQGGMTLAADSLQLYGLDLDALLEDYRKSQNFNLVDVGAFMLTGPAGPVLTKGNDFAKLLSIKLQPTDKTEVVRFFANWNISGGMLAAQDVALSTRKNRVAFMGKIDFAHDTIPGFTVAILDKKGCSIMDQQLFGKLNKPQRGKPNVMGALFGSVTNAVSAVTPTDCKVVYNGSVKHPR